MDIYIICHQHDIPNSVYTLLFENDPRFSLHFVVSNPPENWIQSTRPDLRYELWLHYCVWSHAIVDKKRVCVLHNNSMPRNVTSFKDELIDAFEHGDLFYLGKFDYSACSTSYTEPHIVKCDEMKGFYGYIISPNMAQQCISYSKINTNAYVHNILYKISSKGKTFAYHPDIVYYSSPETEPKYKECHNGVYSFIVMIFALILLTMITVVIVVYFYMEYNTNTLKTIELVEKKTNFIPY